MKRVKAPPCGPKPPGGGPRERRILSIDGGGLHGIISATVLAHIEDRAGRRTGEMFDLVAGTSAGGLIALGLCKPQPMEAREILRLFTTRAGEIFPKRWPRLPWLFRPKYRAEPFERALKRTLGFHAVSSCKPLAMVTAYDVEQRRPRFFKSWRGEAAPLWSAARATGAAPTYFPPFGALVDGGVFVNNPAMCAYAEAQKLWPGEKCLVVSLGTGEHTRPMDKGKASGYGLLGWAPWIISVMIDGQSDAAAHHLDYLPNAEHVRLQTKLEMASDDFDDAGPENVAALREEARQLVAEHKQDLDRLVARLAP
jgi:predicted acylesterase/phospholipase RssA